MLRQAGWVTKAVACVVMPRGRVSKAVACVVMPHGRDERQERRAGAVRQAGRQGGAVKQAGAGR